ncbi:MAG: type III restriction-modification system endonuclease [Robiginitomaculum sp.]|nr:type III restriction-modification system endonuclease [Robiginitomaculum sp.]
MAGFVFEHNLKHQSAAVAGVMRALSGIDVAPALTGTQNPTLVFDGQQEHLRRNIEKLASDGDWAQAFKTDTTDIENLIFDISMETGTGKTYAYTKTMLELNKQTGIAKFIIAVPRVAIKAGTVSFLKSPAAREHFRDEFERDIKVYEVQSQKGGKGKKERMPQAVADFCRADCTMNKKAIHVLVINSGMITSKTLEKKFDVALFDEFNVPHEALAATKPVLIIDEPHMFKRGNKAFNKLMRFKPQFSLRYGATFDDDLINLVYELTAVEAFNTDLVKGITVHTEQFDSAKNITLRLISSDPEEARFELNENGIKTSKKIAKKTCFESIHPEMKGLEILNMNKKKVILSNGLELCKGNSINPYSYAETLQEKMIQNTIVTHFENERKLLLSSPRIKPLSLFFIDNIESYRDKAGGLRVMFEGLLTAHIKALISKETDAGYKAHLQAALKDISALHGGYFSADNSESDEKIEQETLEILHDKEALLDINNPRRFVFSKWTLREGWDNPNVFAICKLRSSGSETSKLQEVGRGLRLPVNEHMGRDKDKQHELHYFVDFTETDFIETLTGEINSNSGGSFHTVKLDDALKQRLYDSYDEFKHDEDTLLESLVGAGIITISQKYKAGGYDKLKSLYPLVFGGGLKQGKVKKSGGKKTQAIIRTGKYKELKELWEAINEKVVLEYKVKDENQFQDLFKDYMNQAKKDFEVAGSISMKQRLTIDGNEAGFSEEVSLDDKVLPFVMMGYSEFLRKTSEALALNISTLHRVFTELRNGGFAIDNYMSQAAIRKLKVGFNDYLMGHAFGKFEIGFKQTKNQLHPTKFTNSDGKVLTSINSGDVGVFHKDGSPPQNYFFDDIYYDGELELANIETEIKEVVVYSKIPKNSIRIPLVGGGTYSPDFAYVVNQADGGSKLFLVVETKGKAEIDLGEREAQKIKHAEEYFNSAGNKTKIVFKRQLRNDKMLNLIKDARGVSA